MKTCVLLVFMVSLSLFSCKQGKEEVVRVDVPQYTVVTDSIYSKMPGSIFYQDGIIYWQDVFSTEKFMHAVDAVTGREILSFGGIGSAPEEFSLPLFSLASPSGLFINDLEKNLEVLYQIDKQKDSLMVSVATYENKPRATRLLHLKDEGMLYFSPDKKEMFDVYMPLGHFAAGVSPVSEDISNGYDIFQGNLGYNAKNACLVYQTFRFPYLAVYQLSNGELLLKKELKPSIEYAIVDKELKLDKKASAGAMELALTDKYIVLLQRDEVVEGNKPEASSPRDLSVLPRSLFIYDYDLNLKKIINMPFPLLRLCGDMDSDTVYAVGVNPEFMILKIDLAD